MIRTYLPYDFFILDYDHGEFRLTLITSDYFWDISFAKIALVHCFGLGPNDVGVVVDHRGTKHYYHPKHRVWYKNISERKALKLFSWLVPSGQACPFGCTSDMVDPERG